MVAKIVSSMRHLPYTYSHTLIRQKYLRTGFCGQVSENLYDVGLGPTNTHNSIVRDFLGLHRAHGLTDDGEIC